jgi:HPt (histidine-containing phosphotransfer) domain-containing protein
MDAQGYESGDRHPALDKEAFEGLVEMIGPDTPEVIIDLIDIYLEESAGLVETLKAGPEGQDQAFLRAAHSLKSSSASVGGKLLSSLSADLESHMRNPTGEMDIPLQVSKIVAEHRRVCDALRAERAKLVDAA